MIPITVSYFAKANSDGQKNGYLGASAYCLGIVSTFTFLGLFVTVLFGAGGIQKLATNPYLNLGLALLFVVLALSLFGVYEFRLPGAFVNKAHSATTRGGIVGPVMMGLTFTLTSFTCTVPFVGTVLAGAANGGSLGRPIVGMLAFSTAFALPFFLLALFPQYLAKLPKSGSWLNTVKGFMAFLELAAAVKFLSNADLVWQLGAITRAVFLAVWSMIAVLSALYLFGIVAFGGAGDRTRIGPIRMIFAGLMLVATGFCLAGVRGATLGEFNAFLPPDPYPGQKSSGAGSGIQWIAAYSEAVAKAKSENRPMFIDFTGVTCTNCRWMEQNMFTRPEVKRLIQSYIPVELFTDRQLAEDRDNLRLELQLTHEETLPIYVIVAPDGTKLSTFEGSTRDADRFIAFLESGHQPSAVVASK